MSKYAVVNVETGVVENVALWDGESEWSLPEGCEAFQSDIAGIGWSFAAGEFVAPAPTAKPVPTPEEALAVNNDVRDKLLTRAALDIAPLQDAVDLDIATADEKGLLIKWKKYRVDLNRVDLTHVSPVWPSLPA